MNNLNQQLVQAIDRLCPEAGLYRAPRCFECNGSGKVQPAAHIDPVDCPLCDNVPKEPESWLTPELRHVLWALSRSGRILYYCFGDIEVLEIVNKKRENCKYPYSKSLFSQEDSIKEFLLNLLIDKSTS